jgi:hypothetical protein
MPAKGLGIKGGVSVILVSQDTVLHMPDNTIGMRVGLFYSFKISEKISIDPEIAFVMKGVDYYADRLDKHVNFNFIEIPVVLHYRFLKNINIFLGPYFGFLVNQIEIEERSSDNPLCRDGWTWVDSVMNKFDFGISLGIRLLFGQKLFVEIMFNKGLNKFIYNDRLSELYSNYNPHRNNTLTLQLGVFF